MISRGWEGKGWGGGGRTGLGGSECFMGGVSVWGDEKVLKLDSGDGFATL